MSSKNFMAYGDAETVLTGFANKINANTKGVAEQKVLLPATVGWTGKNLLPSTAVTQSLYGVTFTVNADKSITLENSSTGNFAYVVYEGSITVPANCVFSIGAIRHASTQIQVLIDGTSYYIPADKEYVEIPAGTLTRCRIDGNQYFSTDTPITYYPMVYDKRITDSTYEPYHKSVEECKQDKALSSAVSVGGVSQTTVEGAIGALAALPNGNKVVKIDISGSSAVTAQYFSATLSAVPSISVGDILVLAIHCNHTFNGGTGAGWGLAITVDSSTTNWSSNLFRNYPEQTSSSSFFTSVFKDSFVPTGKVFTFVCFEMSGTTPHFLMIAEENAQPEEQTVTLSTSATTTVTFTRDDITTDSVVEVGISEWGLVPEDVVCSAGSCTVTLPKVSSAHSVTVRLYVR